MHKNKSGNSNQLTLAIHNTNDSFGFAFRNCRDNLSDKFFFKKFDKDLCNNLIVDLTEFVGKKNLYKINKISVSIGPSNFNASRLIVVLARTLSQQINCQLDSFSSFELMAKRIALKNNFNIDKQSFWIFNKLKRRGYIAGKYKIYNSYKNGDFFVSEIVIPKLLEKLSIEENSFQAEYNDLEDLRELLNLSNQKIKNSNYNSWKEVFPIYPISPIN